MPLSSPLVLDSPHSGTHYPEDFRPVCDLATLRREKGHDIAAACGQLRLQAKRAEQRPVGEVSATDGHG